MEGGRFPRFYDLLKSLVLIGSRSWSGVISCNITFCVALELLLHLNPIRTDEGGHPP